MTFSLGIQVAVLAAFLLAGTVKGTIGMGMPTVAIGLLGLVMVPAEAAALLVVPSLVTNIWQMSVGGRFVALLRRLWPMLVTMVPGALIGIGVMTGVDVRIATAGLGAVLLAYGAFGLLAREFTIPARAQPWLSPPVGFVTGLVTGATGVFVLPSVPYLQALGLARDELVPALGITFTVSTIGLALALSQRGLLTADFAALSLVAVLPALLGMVIGQALRRRMSAARFKVFFFWGVLLLGVQLLVKSLT
jgi:uncharacterized protein